ncbi:MAG: DNA mismatch repair protein MutS [Euryarchaeota archaeon]|nr:DNA mismatch repair protein MutS [Euryarchaeota archaeon]
MGELTPMMEQYQSMKREYPDYILLYRLGDFYETFGEDAATTSRELHLVLTSRNKGGDRIPMAGIPFHAAGSYIRRLIRKGFKVAICEQMEDPALAKGIVRREVVRVITPGTVLEDSMLEHKLGNYLVAVSRGPRGFGLSAVEVSTGEFFTMELSGEEAMGRLSGEVARLRPSECLLPRELFTDRRFTGALKTLSEMTFVQLDEGEFEPETAARRLREFFGVPGLEGFGCAGLDQAVSAAGAIVSYLDRVRKGSEFCIDTLSTIPPGEFLVLDSVSQRNLELVGSLRDGSTRGTLLEVIDHTVTPMGARLLRRWLLQPLMDIPAIRGRLGAVRELLGNAVAAQTARELLRDVHDLERLNGRASFGNASPRDLSALGASLRVAARLRLLFEGSPSQRLAALAASLDPLEDVSGLLSAAIVPDPPATTRDAGFMQDGHSAELDGLRGSVRDAKDWLASLETKERERTGIRSLKVGFNRVFGYYIEVTKPNLGAVPADYIRKQTIATGERYITEELERYEGIVLSAEERMLALEQRLFAELMKRVAAEGHRVLATARAVAELDALRGLAEAAGRNGYAEPSVDDGEELIIKDGRHPVVERMFRPGDFVPNDTATDCTSEQIMLITGPNMAGKSTYMRQVALIVIMAQMGSFVPARSARIGTVDRIFTRVGAADDLVRGQSTFMVEMIETANILNNATRRSLVLLDEIGRGTSTFDGLSIAWSVAEYLHNEPRAGCKTLFATHYHQLTELARSLPRVKNYHMPVKEAGEEIVFLRKVLPGSVDRSYGIQVARLAGLPRKVTERARRVLRSLERENPPGRVVPGGRSFAQSTLFPGEEVPHPVLEEIGKLDLMNMTPVQALNALHELQGKLGDRAARKEATR